MSSTAQERFDEKYITSSEIVKRLNISRPAVYFRRKQGLLPDSITILGQQLVIWERKQIEPYLLQWETHLNNYRAKKAQAQ